VVESVNLVVHEVLTGGVCSETWTANSNIKQIQNKYGGAGLSNIRGAYENNKMKVQR